ncbi:TRAP transporter substrate-binding protein DctP [Deltaproteobacteria bacterium]|nr:TRAP transporter substrate-binding protein DctP [Deltaproteobacteria bacterium]
MINKTLYSLLVLTLVTLPIFAACNRTETTDVITLKFSCPMTSSGIANQYGKYFCDYVEDKTEGRIIFRRFSDGLLGGPTEHLDLCTSGAVDVISSIHNQPEEKMPLHNILPMFVLGDQKKALDFAKQVEFEIPETSAILQQEWTDNNLKLLYPPYSAAGQNAIVSREVFSSLSDLDGRKIAVRGTMAPLYKKIGVTQITVAFPDVYESLSRGVVDMTSMSIGSIKDSKWYEVTKCYMADGSYPYSTPLIVNLDTWNSLTPDVQEIFNEAAQAAQDFSLQFDAETTAASRQRFEECGLVIGELTKEDQEWLYAEEMEIWKNLNMKIAERAGKLEEAEIVWNYAEKLLMGNSNHSEGSE